MFSENTLKDMETIDILVSQKNKELFDLGSNLFLSWTFPTNHHHHNQVISKNYFIVWCGETGVGSLRSVYFGSIEIIPSLLSTVSEEMIKNILDRKQ